MRIGRKGDRKEIVFSESENQTVKRINEIAKPVYEKNSEIGKVVNELVETNGGVAYGDDTLGRLAKHPNLRCSIEQVRKCWNFYRLLLLYGERLDNVASGLDYSHKFQLSRLFQIANEEEQATAIIEMAVRSKDQKMNAPKLEESITAYLERNGYKKKGKPKQKKQEPAPDPYSALCDNALTVTEAAKSIVAEKTIGRLAEIKLATNKLGFAYLQLANRLIRDDPDVETAVRTHIERLTAILNEGTENKGVQQ